MNKIIVTLMVKLLWPLAPTSSGPYKTASAPRPVSLFPQPCSQHKQPWTSQSAISSLSSHGCRKALQISLFVGPLVKKHTWCQGQYSMILLKLLQVDTHKELPLTALCISCTYFLPRKKSSCKQFICWLDVNPISWSWSSHPLLFFGY